MVVWPVIYEVEPRRPFGGVFDRTGSLEGPTLSQPGRYPSDGSHEPGTRIGEAAEWDNGRTKVPLGSFLGWKRCVCRTV
jgi:hypothetical protein